jgi:hypothetical protein
MFFGDGTYSKGDPDMAHLTFTQKSVWGRVVKISIQSSIHTKGHPELKRKNDDSSTLLYIKNNYYKK